MTVSSAAEIHEFEKVRLRKWGAAHLVHPDSKEVSRITWCGRRYFRGDGMDPREDNPGTCVQCRDKAMGRERVHVATLDPDKNRRTRKAWKRRRRRKEEDAAWRRNLAQIQAPERKRDAERSREVNEEKEARDSGFLGRERKAVDALIRTAGRFLRFGGDR